MRTSTPLIGLTIAGTLLFTGCASAGSDTTAASATATSGTAMSETPSACTTEQAFPVTIEHALGTTTIASKPERVAAVAWANHEVPIALGVIPVGMSKATWGDDDGDGVLPWVEDALTERGASTPVLFDETDGINFEAVAATEPDIILASYSGITAEEYATLSKIAPVVAYPDVAWGTSWEEMVSQNSKAIGLSCEGDELIAATVAEVAAGLAAHPELQGKKVLFSYIDPADLSQVGFYTSHDTRPGFLAELGMPMPAIVEEVSATTTEFYSTISAEQADKFDDVDIFVTYGDPGSNLLAALQADPLLGKIPAVKNGNVVILENSTPLAASANPSPLSIGWGIDDYFALLAGAPTTN